MGSWENYASRIEPNGSTRREYIKKITTDRLNRKIINSLSYKNVLINDVPQNVAIINKSKLYEKKICSLPNEHLIHGGLVDWCNNKWLITQIDAHNELYETGIMQQCNYPLKWLNKNGEIVEKWCIVEDGTKYLIGEKAADIMAIGDARIAITIGKDSDTMELSRGKRFLVDDLDSSTPLAYQITKPNKLYNIYDGKGVFRFILNEVNLTDNDNTELMIADYYNDVPPIVFDKNKEVWI